MARKHNVDEVIRALTKKGCKIGVTELGIPVIDLEKAKEMGNKSWGKVDFLVNYYGFTTIHMKSVNKSY